MLTARQLFQRKHLPIYLFSFFLAFGKFDPFGTNGLYFDALTLIAIFYIAVSTDVLKRIDLYKVQLFYLFSVAILFFLAGLLYGFTIVEVSYLNVKYIAAIIIFWFFTHVFRKDPILCYFSILIFSISSALIASLYSLGFLDSYALIRSSRLYLFEENPNSSSSRMAISFIVLLYFVVQNPLNFTKLRYLLFLGIPSIITFIIATGSRGSFLAIVFGIVLIVYFSSIRVVTKISLGVVSFIALLILIQSLNDTTLMERLTGSSLTGSREEIWGDALSIFYDHPWGVGEGGYLTEMMSRFSYIKDTHNFFLYILVCGGWLSLFFILLFLKDIGVYAWERIKMRESLAIIIFVFLIYLAGKTGGAMTYLIMWYFMAVTYSLNYKGISTKKNFSLSG